MATDRASTVIKARLLALDSSHLIALARDSFSPQIVHRESGRSFERLLLERGCVPLLSWHHFEELLKHRDPVVVADRIAFLRSLPMVAWIPCLGGQEGLGTVLDIMVAEVEAAFETPDADVVAIRDLAAAKLIKVGAGEQAISPYVEIWRQLQPVLWQREERAREIVAISHATSIDISKTKVVNWINGQKRTPKDAERQLQSLGHDLTEEIRARGDRRISNASAVATRFLSDVTQDASLVHSDGSSFALQYLVERGIESTDIGPDTTMGEISDLVMFRQRLRLVSEILGVSWPRLAAGVGMERIPSCVIQNSLRKCGQDLPEHKGGDLTDRYLTCLAGYADITFVDKRTKENVLRAHRKCPEFAMIVRQVEKAGRYSEIAEFL